jgi:hypothetical protein
MFTASDIDTVFAYNSTAGIFRVTETKRVLWDVRNMHKQHLNTVLSRPVVYAEDFAQLKKQVRNVLKQRGVV